MSIGLLQAAATPASHERPAGGPGFVTPSSPAPRPALGTRRPIPIPIPVR